MLTAKKSSEVNQWIMTTDWRKRINKDTKTIGLRWYLWRDRAKHWKERENKGHKVDWDRQYFCGKRNT